MTTYINILEANENDYTRLIEIENNSFDSDRITLEELYNPDYSIFTLHVNDDIAGFYISYLEEDNSEYLYTLEIDPQYRGRGYSKMLLQHYIDNKTLSCGPCSLHCRVDNVVAIKLYSSYDFKIVEEEDGFYDDGGKALKLIRS